MNLWQRYAGKRLHPATIRFLALRMAVDRVGRHSRRLSGLAVAAIFLALAATTAHAQNFTNVTATVTDPNGIPYSNAVLNGYLVPQGPYTLGGFPYAGTVGPVTANVNGVFNFVVGSNAAITPGGTQWVFQVTIQPGIAPPLGTGSQSFNTSASPQTISGGSTVNLSTLFNSLAPKLTNFASATAGCSVPSGTINALLKDNGSGGCTDSLAVDNGTLLNYSGTGGIEASGGPLTAGSTPCPAAGIGAVGGFCASESSSTGWTPTANTDYLRADSSTHNWVESLNAGAEIGLPQKICSQITLAMRTSLISSATTDTAVTGACTGLTTSDTISCTFAANPTSSTGFTASTSGILTIFTWPTANTINAAYQNNTAASITPAAQTLHCDAWR